jgi:hypothetical protein
VSSGAQPLKTRLAAALAFKNFIRHNYVVRVAARDRWEEEAWPVHLTLL